MSVNSVALSHYDSKCGECRVTQMTDDFLSVQHDQPTDSPVNDRRSLPACTRTKGARAINAMINSGLHAVNRTLSMFNAESALSGDSNDTRRQNVGLMTTA